MKHCKENIDITRDATRDPNGAGTLRNQNIEAVRIAAAFGIVLFHSGAPGAQVGYSGLVAFTILATYFANGGPRKLAMRVMIPWVFWSIFYVGWRYAAHGRLFHEGLSPFASIMYGTHLWFLPFIFIANLVVSSVGWRHLPVACALASLVLLAAAPWSREVQTSAGSPVAQYLQALPAALIGVALRQRMGVAISAMGLAACLFWNVPGMSLPYAVGGSAVIAAMHLPRLNWKVEAVSSCMFGVYLVHIAVLGACNQLLVPREPSTAAAAFVAALLGVWLVRRLLPQARLVLG